MTVYLLISNSSKARCKEVFCDFERHAKPFVRQSEAEANYFKPSSHVILEWHILFLNCSAVVTFVPIRNRTILSTRCSIGGPGSLKTSYYSQTQTLHSYWQNIYDVRLIGQFQLPR